MLMSLPSKFHLEIELPESNMSINNGTGAIRIRKLVREEPAIILRYKNTTKSLILAQDER